MPAADAARPRLLALDVDGTIVARGNKPSLAVSEGLCAAIEAGVRVVLATGRELHNVIELCAHVGAPEMWVVCSNGAVTARVHPGGWDLTETVTFDPRPAIAALLRAAPGLRYAIEEVGVGHRTRGTFGEAEIPGPHFVLEGPIPHEATLVVTASDTVPCSEMVAAVANLGLALLPYPEGSSAFLDLSAGHVSKATGVRALAEAWGVPPEACVAVGDYLNDIELVEWAGRGIAMGHAPEALRSVADEVVGSINEEGLVEVLDSILAAHASIAPAS
jgi:hydroxymethylpyrimidine pyrophosphatase-like HAD family hydrolase